MKNLIQLFMFLVIGFATYAQQDQQNQEEEEETTYTLGEPITDTIEVDGKQIVKFDFSTTKEEQNVIREYLIIGLGVNPVMHSGSFDLPDTNLYDNWELNTFKSTNVYLGLIHYKINLADNLLYLHTGLDLDMKKFMFDNNFIIDADADTWQTTNFSADTKKNKLGATYLELPLLLSFDSNNSVQAFSVDVGGYAGLRLGSRQKIKFEDKDDNIYSDKNKKKFKEQDSFNLNNFTYGLEGQIGYGGIHLYTKYSLQDLFEEDAGNPELNPLSIGILLNPF